MVSFMVDVNAFDGGVLHLPSVDREGKLLLHEQVAASIRRAIADGEAAPGDKIPQARDLAAILGVNTNTVLRAIRQLRDEGILEAGRGKATTVAGTPDRSALISRARDLVDFGASHGYGRGELMKIIAELP
jgi:GntR family transcriptional regulator